MRTGTEGNRTSRVVAAFALLAALLAGCGPDCSGDSGDSQKDAEACYGRD